MMWCACCCFFLPLPWLNVQHFPLVKYSWPAYNVWGKRQGKKRKAETAANCEERVSVTACYLWTHRKISLHCFSCHFISVTKAGKIGFMGKKKKTEVSILKHRDPYRHRLWLCAADWRSPGGFNWLFSSCHICDPPHYKLKSLQKNSEKKKVSQCVLRNLCDILPYYNRIASEAVADKWYIPAKEK